MKLLFDFFPVILFFIAFKLSDDPHQGVLVATGVAIIASIVQVAILWLVKRRVEKMHLITLALMIVMGGLTLLLNDERFIKWKPTLVNWAFALAFLGSQFIGHKPILKRMMDSTVSLPEVVWLRLNLAWISFFIIVGCINLYVAFSFSTEIWVDFKLFGMLGLTVVFVIAQTFYLMRHATEPATENNQED